MVRHEVRRALLWIISGRGHGTTVPPRVKLIDRPASRQHHLCNMTASHSRFDLIAVIYCVCGTQTTLAIGNGNRRDQPGSVALVSKLQRNISVISRFFRNGLFHFACLVFPPPPPPLQPCRLFFAFVNAHWTDLRSQCGRTVPCRLVLTMHQSQLGFEPTVLDEARQWGQCDGARASFDLKRQGVPTKTHRPAWSPPTST